MNSAEKASLWVAGRLPSLEMSSGSDDGVCNESSRPQPDRKIFGSSSRSITLTSVAPSERRFLARLNHQRFGFRHKSTDTVDFEHAVDGSHRHPFDPSPMLVSRRSKASPRRFNRVMLHIYDLISSDALMQLPWGCVCEIGKCFNDVNSALHELGTGVYHVGVECNGIEYAYGACSQSRKSGVFSCIPKLSPGYQYRSSIDFGEIQLIRSSWTIVPTIGDQRTSPRSVASTSFQQVEEFVDGKTVLKEMAAEYMGTDYDLLRRNCCTFAADVCIRLGVPHDQIPNWFRNLAETGAYSQDMANATFVEPLQIVLSTASPENSICGAIHMSSHSHARTEDEEPGFEVIAKRNASNTRNVVMVIDAEPNPRPYCRSYRRAVTSALQTV